MSAQNNTQRGPCHCDFGIAGIVMRRNVLFDRWMTLFYVMEIILTGCIWHGLGA